MNAKIIRREEEAPSSSWQLSRWASFYPVDPWGWYCTHLWLADVVAVMVRGCARLLGGQIAAPSSRSLKSGEELQVPGFLQSMENSAASLLPNTAYGRACPSVSHFVLVLDWVWMMPRKSMEVIQALRGMDIFCPHGLRGSCACESSGNR